MLLLCPLPPGGQRHQPARSHHSGAPGARLPATRISIRQVHCRTSPAPGNAQRAEPARESLPERGLRPNSGRLGGYEHRPGRPRAATAAQRSRTTMDVPELDSDWTGGAANEAPTTII